MPFRPLANPFDLCRICSSPTTESCRNCKQFYCASRLKSSRCSLCEKQLVAMARQGEESMGGVLFVVGFVLFFVGAVALKLVANIELGSRLYIVSFLGLIWAIFLFALPLAGKWIRRSLADRQLSPILRDPATE